MDLIREIESYGAFAELDGDQLKVKNGKRLPDDLRERIKANREVVVAHLRTPRPTISYDKGVATVHEPAAWDRYCKMWHRPKAGGVEQ